MARKDDLDDIRRIIDEFHQWGRRSPNTPGSAEARAFRKGHASGMLVPSIDGEGHSEPHEELSEDEERIYVTVELPAMSVENVNVEVGHYSIIISADHGRYFQRVVELPARVNPDAAQTSFVNGVLDVVLRKVKDRSAN